MDKCKNLDRIEQPVTIGQLIEDVFIDEHATRSDDFLLVGLQGIGVQEWSRQLELVGWEDEIDHHFRLFGGRLVLSQEHKDLYRGTIGAFAEASDRFELSYDYATEIGDLATKRLFRYDIDPNTPIDDDGMVTRLLKAHLLKRGQDRESAKSS